MMTVFEALGSFAPFCKHAGPFAPCLIYANDSYYESARSTTFFSLGDKSIYFPATVIGDFLVAVLAFVMAWMCYRKRVAVGHKEMCTLWIFYGLSALLEAAMLALSGVLTNDILKYVAIAQAAMVGMFLWTLVYNGFVGYQLLDDGEWPSMLGLLGGAFLLGGGYAVLMLLPSLSLALDMKLFETLFFAVWTLLPVCAVLTYFIAQTVLVLRALGDKKPLLYLSCSAFCFVLSAACSIISVQVSFWVNRHFDGSALSSLFAAVAMLFVMKFWSFITEDDSSSVVDGKNFSFA